MQISNSNQLIHTKKKIYLFLFLFLYLLPISAFSKDTALNTSIYIESQKTFASMPRYDNLISVNLTNKHTYFKSNISLNFNSENQLTFDQSYVEYKNNNKIFGIGKFDRNWSFSPNTSLILSTNARPTDSIYFTINNKEGPHGKIISLIGPWSFEVFNAFQSGSNKVNNSMLLGMRAIAEPVKNLKFELLKTSQWGGDNQPNNLSSLKSAIVGNSNEYSHSAINQMAGFGVSFLKNFHKIQSRSYAQFIGEDEAGGLPSCFMSLIGNEFYFTNKNLIQKFGVEYIDTRIKTTRHGNCGNNSAYNNGSYDYINYGKVLGAPIDTEGKSFHSWATKKLSEKISVKYSIKNYIINDTNWSSHRLSSTKQNGWQTNISTNWEHNSYNLSGILTFQDFLLNKVNYNQGFSLRFKAAFNF